MENQTEKQISKPYNKRQRVLLEVYQEGEVDVDFIQRKTGFDAVQAEKLLNEFSHTGLVHKIIKNYRQRYQISSHGKKMISRLQVNAGGQNV